MRRPTLRPVQLALLLLVVAAPLAAAGSDSPQWRGPDRTGISPAADLLAEWPDDGPPILWRIDDIGAGFGSVATQDGTVYIQGTQDGDSAVFSRNAEDGSAGWTTTLGPLLVQDRGNGPRGTPTVVGDHLFVITGTGILAKLQRSDGKVVWQKNLLTEYGASNPYWGISESPLVLDGVVYAMPGGSKATVVALATENGNEIWAQHYGHKASYSSLMPATFHGVDVLVGFTQSAGIGVRRSDGELVWEYAAPANRTANAATPVIGGNIVVYSSGYGTGAGAIEILEGEGGKLDTRELWFQSRLQNHHGGIVLYDGHLYGFFGNALACADLRTGEIAWQARSVGKGSLTIADGKLFLLGERHRVGLADATSEAYRERGRFDLERIDEPSWAYPVVSDGRLYIRDQNTLTAYDVSAK